MEIIKRVFIIVFCLLLIPVTAVATAGLKQRFADGPNLVFSGGPLLEGELYTGVEPNWRFVSSIQTIEMQLLDPPTSRRIWTAEFEGKLYVWSGYMGSTVGRLWKRWPVQAEQDGRALLRIEGILYERELIRIQSGAILDGIATSIRVKYPSQTTRASVEAGDTWVFEVAPRS